MAVMESHGLISWTMAHPDAATALATMALVAVGLVIGAGQIGIVFYGIRKMTDGNAARTAQHKEVMKTEANRHTETMEAETKRHTEAMEASDKRHTEAMEAETKRHQEAMTALHALIRNTSPGPAHT